jgi:hypothetical protein
MPTSAFDDQSRPPDRGELAEVLGPSWGFWDALVSTVVDAHPLTQLWNFSGAKYGWSLRLKRRDRILLYLTPKSGCFVLGVVLGEKAAKAAHVSGLPEEVLALIDDAPRYAEGRGIRLAVSTEKDLAAARMLLALKTAP